MMCLRYSVAGERTAKEFSGIRDQPVMVQFQAARADRVVG